MDRLDEPKMTAESANVSPTSVSSAGTTTLKPVFILGCARSGSTMLGAMVGAHPKVVCIPEGQFIVDVMPKGDDPNSEVDPVDVIDRIVKHWRFRVWEFELGGRRPARDDIKPTYRATIEWLIRQYARAVGRSGAHIWVDQAPEHVFRIWNLLQHFPGAKFIHIVRDGRAVAASIIPLDWGPNEIYSAARTWQERVGYGYVAATALGPERVLHVRYEDVVERTEATMRFVATFLGVEFMPEMLSTTGLRLPRFTRYQHQLIGMPPRPDRTESWRRILSRREIEIFESVVGDLLPMLGYKPVFGIQARPLTFLERRRHILLNEIRKILNSLTTYLKRRRYRP
jgi:Sulfotransferase family